MKKVLLASTALIGLGFISGAALAAESKVTVGGSAEFQAGFFDNDNDLTGGNDRDFLTNTEVHIKADFKADNGLEYGAYIEIENTRNVTNSALDYDEANLYVQGAFGRVEAGDQDGAITQLIVYAPTVGIGQLDGEPEKFLNDIGVYSFYVDLQDNTKVTYVTPRFAGFQAGVSYSPEADQGDSVVRAKVAGSSRDIFEGALNYTNEFGPVTVEASATIITADGDNTATPGSDFTSWTAGLRLGYAGIQVGGGYADLDQAAGASYAAYVPADHAWNVGVAYSTGPFGVAAQYASIDVDGDKDIDQLGVGGTYTLAPGLSLNADYIFIDNAFSGNENSLFILGTKLAF